MDASLQGKVITYLSSICNVRTVEEIFVQVVIDLKVWEKITLRTGETD